MKTNRAAAVLVGVTLLGACGDAGSGHSSTSETQAPATNPLPEAAAYRPTNRTEKALIDQVSCASPPQAGVAMKAMLRNHLIATTEDGGDGIALFVPVKPMSLFGFDVIRMGGWQADPAGGAMEPFGRGPGTAPPNHIFVTVRAAPEEVHATLAKLEIAEARYEPDYSQDAWVDADGTVRQPQRLVPGPRVEAGDHDFASNPVDGATTIACSAEAIDFEREVESQFTGQT